MNFNSILIGTDDAQRLGDYYTKVLGEPGYAQDGFFGWQIGSGYVSVAAHSEVHGATRARAASSGTSRAPTWRAISPVSPPRAPRSSRLPTRWKVRRARRSRRSRTPTATTSSSCLRWRCSRPTSARERHGVDHRLQLGLLRLRCQQWQCGVDDDQIAVDVDDPDPIDLAWAEAGADDAVRCLPQDELATVAGTEAIRRCSGSGSEGARPGIHRGSPGTAWWRSARSRSSRRTVSGRNPGPRTPSGPGPARLLCAGRPCP